MSKKITQILYSGLGGHASVAFSLVEASTSESNINLHMIFYGIEPVKEAYLKICKEKAIPASSILKQVGIDIRSYRILFSILRQQRPAAVILHSINLIPVVYVASLLYKFKVVAVEHQSNLLKKKREWVFSALCLILADTVIYLTENYKQEIKKKLPYFFRGKKVKVIPNGINVDYFKPKGQIREKLCRFGMISRLNELKDHKTLLQSFALLGNKNIELIIAGEGPTLPDLKELASDLSIGNQVIFAGLLEGQSVINFFHDIDAYVHASFGETMSTAIMQAMSCGLPVIASDVKGINNMLVPNQTALLVPVSNPEKMCLAMEDLTASYEKRKLLSQNARSYAVRFFGLQKMFDGYREVLNK